MKSTTAKNVKKKKNEGGESNKRLKKGRPSQLRSMPTRKKSTSSPSILRKKKGEPVKNPLRKTKSSLKGKNLYGGVKSKYKKKKKILGKPNLTPLIRADQYPDRESVLKLRKRLDNFSLRQLLEMKVVDKDEKKSKEGAEDMITPTSPLSTLRILNSRTRRNKFANSKLGIHDRLYDKRNYSGVAKKKVEDLGYSNPNAGEEFLKNVTKSYMDKYNLEKSKKGK